MKYLCACITLGLICSVSAMSRPITREKRKIIIDTDVGSDDAVAVLLSLGYEKSLKNSADFEILAITCVYGNTYESNVERNVLKTLTIADRPDMPVYGGAQKPLINRYVSSDFFGTDGLGDFNFTENIVTEVDKSKTAAVFLTELVRKYPGEITILCLGPVTNIAIAMSLDPTFAKNVKELFIMGGSVAGRGNAAPNVEFNFSYDPESNVIVFDSDVKIPITLFPWETALSHFLSKDFRQNVFGSRDSKVVDFLNKAERIYLEKENVWTVVDAMTAGIMIWPELITNYTLLNVTPVTDGAARGSILVDYAETTGKKKNAKIIQGYDIAGFQKNLLQYIN